MEPFIVTDAITPERPRNLISEFVADLLLLLVSRSPVLFEQIDPVMEVLIAKYNDPKPVYWLKRYRREITQEYHNQCMPELSIEEIARDFEMR